MRWRRLFITYRLIAAALVLAASPPAVGGQPAAGLDLPAIAPGGPPADSGKPAISGPPAAAPGQGGSTGGTTGCAPPLPCGTQLLGSVRKNGAVELRMPALRW